MLTGLQIKGGNKGSTMIRRIYVQTTNSRIYCIIDNVQLWASAATREDVTVTLSTFKHIVLLKE